MPRIILTSRYMKPAKGGGHKSSLVKYIATREGAEPVMVVGERKNYVGYLANRPRAHGLFTDSGKPVALEKIMDEVAGYPGKIWTTVISLRREDAERLGYDNAGAWMGLIRSKRVAIAEHMRIKQENLKWYAAFHNESHHPHVHMIAFSTNPKEGYLTNTGIEKMRSMFAREIFRQDLIQIYQEQTERRGIVNEQAKKTMDNLITQMRIGGCVNPQLEADILLLAKRLKNTRGKKVYGYLQPELKAIINRIIDALAKTDDVARAYDAWVEMRNEVLLTYTDTLPEPLPLSGQKEFAKIRQIIIDEAQSIPVPDGTPFPDAPQVPNSSALPLIPRLLNRLSRIFQDNTNNIAHPRHTDSKARRKEREKKIAQGHAHDDHAQEQIQ